MESWEGAGAELGLCGGEEGAGLGSPSLGLFRREEGKVVLELGGCEGVLCGSEGSGGGGEDAAPPASSPGFLLRLWLRLRLCLWLWLGIARGGG